MPHKEKKGVDRNEFVRTLPDVLQSIQDNLLERAKRLRAENTRVIDDQKEFIDFFNVEAKPGKPTPIHGGFVLSHFAGDSALEEQIKKEHGISVRCIPNPGQLDQSHEPGKCIFTGKPASQRVLWAKAY
jgi:prolyl-tRNA synthetase